jgi:hypothetical protein
LRKLADSTRHDWRDKPEADKTYALLRKHFKEADKDNRASLTTDGNSGCTANAAIISDMTQALANLSNNTTTQFALLAEAQENDRASLVPCQAELAASRNALVQATNRPTNADTGTGGNRNGKKRKYRQTTT